MNGKFTLKYIITLYSEMIWLYFGLIVWSKLEWEVEVFPSMVWFIGPSIIAILLYFLTGRFIKGFYIQYSIVLAAFVGYIVLVWSEVAQNGGLAYKLTVCAIVFHLFLRSLYFLNKHPKRMQMLLRFEGNIFFYIFFVLFFHVNPAIATNLHVYFFAAILLSLIGMVLTLYPEENNEDEDEDVEIKAVGDVGWLSYIVISVVVIVVAFGFLLLLPSVHNFVVSALTAGWNGVLKVGGMLQATLLWLMSLFPTPDARGPIDLEPGVGPLLGEAQKDVPTLQVPFFEILTVVGGIGILAVLWYLIRGIKKDSGISKVKQRRKSIKRTKSLGLFGWILALLKKSWIRIARNFPFYYENPIYLEYYKLLKWGRKQGHPKLPTETPHEYVKRLVRTPLYSEESSDRFHYSKEVIVQVTDDYTAAYYGKRK